MVVGILILVVVGIFAVVMAWSAFAPVIQQFGTDAPYGKNFREKNSTGAYVDVICGDDPDNYPVNWTKQCFARDNAFRSLLVMPTFLIIAIVGWGFLAAVRRDYGETGF